MHSRKNSINWCSSTLFIFAYIPCKYRWWETTWCTDMRSKKYWVKDLLDRLSKHSIIKLAKQLLSKLSGTKRGKEIDCASSICNFSQCSLKYLCSSMGKEKFLVPMSSFFKYLKWFTSLCLLRFHHQALVEVKILDALRRKDKDNQHNLIHMLEYFYFRNHLCITFELMGYGLFLDMPVMKKTSFEINWKWF